jgi:hypothetical protein
MPKEPRDVSQWRRNAIWMFVVWLLLVIVIGWFPGKLVLHYRQLSKNGATIQGIALGPYPHQQIKYSYAINGRTYQGIGRTDFNGPSLFEIAVGDKISVHYLPDEPEISCLADPEELYSSDLVPTLGASFLFPTMIVIALAIRISRNRRSS